MQIDAHRLNRETRGSVERALVYEQQLAALYADQLGRAGRYAASQFRRRAPISALAAAANPEQPNWTPPDPDELTTEPLDEQARKKAQRIHLQAVIAAAPQTVKDIGGELGISFDATSPFVTRLLDRVGARTASLTQASQDVMRKTLAQAYTEGWSVPQTADMLQQGIGGLGATTAVMQARTDLVGLGNGSSLAAVGALGDAAPALKVWLSAEDELVRPSHADADGQEVPLDQPFQVGDEEAMYPADPDLSDAESCNCRCTIIYSDGSAVDDSLEASAAPAMSGVQPTGHLPSSPMGTDTMPAEAVVAAVTVTVDDADAEEAGEQEMAAAVRWRGVLCVEGEESQDNPYLTRILAPGGGSWRQPPLSLGVMFDTPHSDDADAVVCGRIDSIYRDDIDPRIIWGEGVFNADEVGCQAAEYVTNRSLRGISIDPYVAEIDVQEEPVADGGDFPDVMQPGDASKTTVTFVRYVIGGATVCPFQALENATISIVASGSEHDEARVITDARFVISSLPSRDPEPDPIVAPDRPVLVASATAAAPPREWFETQEPPGPMPLTVTDDGRVFGHLALWDSCHVGLEGSCVRPPKSVSGYAYFHVGELETAAGSKVAVGKLMIAKPGRPGSHASLDASRLEAARHYDDNSAVGAYVCVVDGRYGPWAAGCVRPGLADTELAQLRANPPSGDWRRVNGSLELIAALSVPVPGFPVPRAEASLVAAGDLLEVGALVASSGRVEPSEFVVRALERDGLLPRSSGRVSRPPVAV